MKKTEQEFQLSPSFRKLLTPLEQSKIFFGCVVSCGYVPPSVKRSLGK